MTAETPREIALEIVAIGDRTWRMDVLARAVLAAPEHVETRDWQEMAERYDAAVAELAEAKRMNETQRTMLAFDNASGAEQRLADALRASEERVAELADYQDALRADRIPFAEAYAVAARAEEREACARICDGLITGHKSAATIRARGSQPEACGARVPGGDGLCCQPAGHAGRHDTGSASWPRLPCDDMQPERIAPAEKPAREVVGYRVRYGVGKFAHKSGAYWGEWSDDVMIAKRWAERPAAPHGWRVVRVTRKSGR